jgi:hypothetical protein
LLLIVSSRRRRVVDEAIAAQFLSTFKSLVQTPALLM